MSLIPPTPNVFMPPVTTAFISKRKWRDLFNESWEIFDKFRMDPRLDLACHPDPTVRVPIAELFNKSEQLLWYSRGNNLIYGPLIEELISILKSETPDIVGQYTLYYDNNNRYSTCLYKRESETLNATTYYDALYEMYTNNTLDISHHATHILMNLDIGKNDDETNIVPTLLNMPAGIYIRDDTGKDREIKFELIQTDPKPPTPPPKSIA